MSNSPITVLCMCSYVSMVRQTLARGLTKTNTLVEMLDLNTADSQEMIEVVGKSSAVIVMAPPSEGPANAAINTLVAVVKEKQVSIHSSASNH